MTVWDWQWVTGNVGLILVGLDPAGNLLVSFGVMTMLAATAPWEWTP